MASKSNYKNRRRKSNTIKTNSSRPHNKQYYTNRQQTKSSIVKPPTNKTFKSDKPTIIQNKIQSTNLT